MSRLPAATERGRSTVQVTSPDLITSDAAPGNSREVGDPYGRQTERTPQARSPDSASLRIYSLSHRVYEAKSVTCRCLPAQNSGSTNSSSALTERHGLHQLWLSAQRRRSAQCAPRLRRGVRISPDDEAQADRDGSVLKSTMVRPHSAGTPRRVTRRYGR